MRVKIEAFHFTKAMYVQSKGALTLGVRYSTVESPNTMLVI